MNEPGQIHQDSTAFRAMLDAIANGVGLTTGQIPTPVREVTATEIQEQIRRGREAAAQMRNQLYPVQPTAAEICRTVDQERCPPPAQRDFTAMEIIGMERIERERINRSRERIRAVFNGLPPHSDQYLPTVFEPQLPPHPSWVTAADHAEYRASREAAEFMVRRAAIEAAKVYVPDPFAAREPWWPDFKHTEFAQKAMRDKARKLVEQFKGNGGRDGCAALNRVDQTEDWNRSLPYELVRHCPAPRQITHNDPDRVRLRAQLIE